ncbi:MAG: outer membrane protein assembly factor BamD [bacterium]|nr:outer membrane protein assembly factor BamD [bacterium]
MPRPILRTFAVLAAALCFATVADAQWVWTPSIGRFIKVKNLPKETAELQVEHARSLLKDGEYKEALAETNKFEDYYADTEYADDNQFIRGEIRMAEGDYMDAAKEFQQVVDRFPDSPLFDAVIAKQYELGDLYYAKGQTNLKRGWWRVFRRRPLKKAIMVYGMVIDNQPFTDAAAQAQYKIGLCNYTLEKYIEAAFEYQRVVEDYSQSDWVDDAAYGLAMCYYESSLPAAYDQAPSALAVRAIDDFKAQFPSDPRIPDLDTKRVEMREVIAAQRLLSAQFYEKRHKFAAAAIYYEVVAEEYEETQAANDARAWLNQHAAGVRRVNL